MLGISVFISVHPRFFPAFRPRPRPPFRRISNLKSRKEFRFMTYQTFVPGFRITNRAQGLAENLPLVSADASLDAYGVKRLW